MIATVTIYATKPDKQIEYVYDAAGLRVQKIVIACSNTSTNGSDVVTPGSITTTYYIARQGEPTAMVQKLNAALETMQTENCCTAPASSTIS